MSFSSGNSSGPSLVSFSSRTSSDPSLEIDERCARGSTAMAATIKSGISRNTRMMWRVKGERIDLVRGCLIKAMPGALFAFGLRAQDC